MSPSDVDEDEIFLSARDTTIHTYAPGAEYGHRRWIFFDNFPFYDIIIDGPLWNANWVAYDLSEDDLNYFSINDPLRLYHMSAEACSRIDKRIRANATTLIPITVEEKALLTVGGVNTIIDVEEYRAIKRPTFISKYGREGYCYANVSAHGEWYEVN